SRSGRPKARRSAERLTERTLCNATCDDEVGGHMERAETSYFTLPGRLAAAAAARPEGTITFINGDDRDGVRWAQLHEDAKGVAAALQARDIGPGSHVSLLAPTSRPLVTTIQAVWLAGATAVVLP